LNINILQWVGEIATSALNVRLCIVIQGGVKDAVRRDKIALECNFIFSTVMWFGRA
jgi:hypothetical protein